MIGIQIKINFLNEYLICIHVSSSKSNSDIIESGVKFFLVIISLLGSTATPIVL